jgi:hypothetical protein
MRLATAIAQALALADVDRQPAAWRRFREDVVARLAFEPSADGMNMVTVACAGCALPLASWCCYFLGPLIQRTEPDDDGITAIASFVE